MPPSPPWITLPLPSWKVNGWPRSHDASNCLPFDHATPTYCICTVSPAFAAGPVPLTMSCVWSCAGGLPVGFGTDGFLLRLVLICPSAVVPPPGVAVGVAFAVAAAWSSGARSPHATTARQQSSTTRRVATIMRGEGTARGRPLLRGRRAGGRREGSG